jgi:hypothetical protein
MNEHDVEASHPSGSHAIQANNGDKAAVFFGALRVAVYQDEDGWAAQGIDLDLFAYGSTEELARANFELGLHESVTHTIARHGSIKGMLVPAPLSVKRQVAESMGKVMRYTCVDVHDVSGLRDFYSSIQYQSAVAA